MLRLLRLLRIFRASLTLSVQRELSHRANFTFEACLAAISTTAGLLALGVLFSQTETLAGWSRQSVIVLLGAFQIINGLLWAFVEPNVSWFGGKVTNGELDDWLLQPVPSLFTASLGTCNPWALLSVASGVIVTILGVTPLPVAPSATNVLAFLALLMTGVALMWASRVLVACLAFWMMGFEPDVLYGALWQLGRYPVNIYHPTIQRVLTYIVPVALITSLPARALTEGVDAPTLFASVVAAVVSVWLVIAVWRLGLRRYTSATS